MEVKISNFLMNKIKDFAGERVKGSEKLYNSRGGSKTEKLRTDIMVGTMGEYAVYKLLKKSGLKCSKPDLNIYKKGKKSFAADLSCDNVAIHVKSQSIESERLYGFSWLVQRTDPIYKSPTPQDVFAFCYVDLEKKLVTFLGFCDIVSIRDLELWDECKVPMFRRTKIALYLSSLADYDIIYNKLEVKLKKLDKLDKLLLEIKNGNL